MIIEKQEVTMTLNKLELELLYDALYEHHVKLSKLLRQKKSVIWENEAKEMELVQFFGGIIGLYDIKEHIRRSVDTLLDKEREERENTESP